MSFTLDYFYHCTKEKYKLTLLTPKVSLMYKITWVQLLEDINNCSFIRGGELIITTGLNARESTSLLSLVQQSHARGACGMILNTGMYLNTVPHELLSWCMENSFPLFSMPWEIHIADLMQDYCNEIISEKRTQETRNSVLLCSLSGGDTSEYQAVLSDFLSCYVVAADNELSINYYASVCHENNYYYICPRLTDTSFAGHCGISNLIGQKEELSLYMKQAYRSMQVSQIKDTVVSYFSDIGLYNAALAIEDLEVLKEAEALLAPLNEENLRETFRLYLEKNGSVQEVADTLFLHRNTVNYRIQKGRSLLPADSSQRNLEYLFAFYLCDCLKLKKGK